MKKERAAAMQIGQLKLTRAEEEKKFRQQYQHEKVADALIAVHSAHNARIRQMQSDGAAAEQIAATTQQHQQQLSSIREAYKEHNSRLVEEKASHEQKNERARGEFDASKKVGISIRNRHEMYQLVYWHRQAKLLYHDGHTDDESDEDNEKKNDGEEDDKKKKSKKKPRHGSSVSVAKNQFMIKAILLCVEPQPVVDTNPPWYWLMIAKDHHGKLQVRRVIVVSEFDVLLSVHVFSFCICFCSYKCIVDRRASCSGRAR